MRRRFDEHGNPDLRGRVAEYGDAMRKRLRWLGPIAAGLVLLIVVLSGTYSVDPGEVGVVRTFGRLSGRSEPGLHFAFPIVQRVDVVDLAKIQRLEIGFRTEGEGAVKMVPAEAQMLTGDENIVEAQMIVQYQIADPEKYLFRLADPEATLRIAAEVALRSVVGTKKITSSVEELAPPEEVQEMTDAQVEPEVPAESAPAASASASAAGSVSAAPPVKPPPAPAKPKPKEKEAEGDEQNDILTKGRERAEAETKTLLVELMDLYESGLRITEVKLRPVDVPDEVKDAFHDVVRAREEREQLINKALGYREDRIPRARGEAQKVLRSAEAYKRERVLRAQGEAAAFASVLAEYKKAKGVTRDRLHLEVMERILANVGRKVFIDGDVADKAVPVLPFGNVVAPGQGATP